MPSRHVTDEPLDPRERFGLYRLCDCTACEGTGKAEPYYENLGATDKRNRCSDCRGEGRVRQEIATAETPEAVGVALVTLAREDEWKDCPFGLLDRTPECEHCNGEGRRPHPLNMNGDVCSGCQGSGIKQTGTWLILPWLPSARNVTDAARTLARSKKS